MSCASGENVPQQHFPPSPPPAPILLPKGFKINFSKQIRNELILSSSEAGCLLLTLCGSRCQRRKA